MVDDVEAYVRADLMGGRIVLSNRFVVRLGRRILRKRGQWCHEKESKEIKDSFHGSGCYQAIFGRAIAIPGSLEFLKATPCQLRLSELVDEIKV